jgi:hypothetical protein
VIAGKVVRGGNAISGGEGHDVLGGDDSDDDLSNNACQAPVYDMMGNAMPGAMVDPDEELMRMVTFGFLDPLSPHKSSFIGKLRDLGLVGKNEVADYLNLQYGLRNGDITYADLTEKTGLPESELRWIGGSSAELAERSKAVFRALNDGWSPSIRERTVKSFVRGMGTGGVAPQYWDDVVSDIWLEGGGDRAALVMDLKRQRNALGLGAILGGLTGRTQVLPASGFSRARAVEIASALAAERFMSGHTALRGLGVTDATLRQKMLAAGFDPSIMAGASPRASARFYELFQGTVDRGKTFSGPWGILETRVATIARARELERAGYRVGYEVPHPGPNGFTPRWADIVATRGNERRIIQFETNPTSRTALANQQWLQRFATVPVEIVPVYRQR